MPAPLRRLLRLLRRADGTETIKCFTRSDGYTYSCAVPTYDDDIVRPLSPYIDEIFKCFTNIFFLFTTIPPSARRLPLLYDAGIVRPLPPYDDVYTNTCLAAVTTIRCRFYRRMSTLFRLLLDPVIRTLRYDYNCVLQHLHPRHFSGPPRVR